MSRICDAIADRALELRAQRQHGAKHFAQRSQIVVRNPRAQLHELLIQHWRGVQHAEDIFRLNFGRAIMQHSDDARHALLAKGHEHAAAHHRLHPVRDAVGKGHIERHGEGDVTKFRHE